MSNFDPLIQDLVIANRILAREKVVDAYGHVSVRHPDNPNRFLIARSLAPELVGPEDIVELDLDAQPVRDEARGLYLERFIHAAIFAARSDVMAVVHAHAEDTLPFGIAQGTKLRGIKANIDWKSSLGAEWRQYEAIFPALARSRIDQVSVECAGAKVPLDLLGLLNGKEVLLGAIDVASERVETPEEVAATIEQASRFVPVERIYPCTNCGMTPMDRSLAISKLAALSAGAALARRQFEPQRR